MGRSLLNRIANLLEIGCIIAIVGGLLGYASFLIAELFGSFRLQFICIALIGILLALIIRRRLLFTLAIPALFLNLLALLPLFSSDNPEPTTSSSPSYRIASFNIHHDSAIQEETLAYLKASSPDFILLIEVTPSWAEFLKRELIPHYPHFLMEPYEGNFGIAFFSKHPLTSVYHVTTHDDHPPAIAAEVSLDNQTIEIISTHPVPPKNQKWFQRRNAQLTALATQIKSSSHPGILIGDFNATPWSPHFRKVCKAGDLHHLGARTLIPTWSRLPSAFLPPFGIPIDHVVATPTVHLHSHQVNPNQGSDHHPIEVSFSINHPQ